MAACNMANLNIFKVRVRRISVYRVWVAIFLIGAIGFGYSYIINKNIIEDIVKPTISGPEGEPVFVKTIYGSFGGGEFDKPMAVTVINNKIYVSDTNNRRIQVFNYEGQPLFKFGERGNGPGQFQFPYGIAGDKKGNVYVADLYNGAVSVFDERGKFIKYFAETKPEENVIVSPGGLHIAEDKLFVTDINNGKVNVFDLKGKLLFTIGSMGVDNGKFIAPNAVTTDLKGNIYVSDTGNQRVQVFDEKGKYLRTINGSKDGKGQSVFVNPRGIGVDPYGRLFVVSNLTHFVYAFDENGKKLYSFGGLGDTEKNFMLPNGLYIDDKGRIYITDTANIRVVIYQIS